MTEELIGAAALISSRSPLLVTGTDDNRGGGCGAPELMDSRLILAVFRSVLSLQLFIMHHIFHIFHALDKSQIDIVK